VSEANQDEESRRLSQVRDMFLRVRNPHTQMVGKSEVCLNWAVRRECEDLSQGGVREILT